jgi:hypothetical protein
MRLFDKPTTLPLQGGLRPMSVEKNNMNRGTEKMLKLERKRKKKEI